MEKHGDLDNPETDPTHKGLWEPIKYKFKHLPIHIALFHTGKILAFGGTGNDEKNKKPYPSEIFDYKTGEISTIQQELDGDIFCAGHAFLPDGRLLVAGGTYKYDGSFLRIAVPPFSGLEQSYIFDPVQLHWTRKENMAFGRWYPTCIMISDGSVLCVAGLTKGFPWVFLNKLEIYSAPQGGWQRVSGKSRWLGQVGQLFRNSSGQKIEGADRWFPLYPRLHLLPSGEIFYAGSYNTHYTFPFSNVYFPSVTFNPTTNTWKIVGNPQNQNREEGTTVLLPFTPGDERAKVILIGGGTPTGIDATNSVELIDLSDDNAKWESISPMAHKRYYSYAVILPDQQILVLGGRKGKAIHTMETMNPMMCMDGEVPHDPDAIMEPELYNPKTGQWSAVATMQVDRVYHSNALLLPDARVMTAGSNPMRRCNELRIEIYDPSYLFKDQRPVIDEVPRTISYGNKFEIKTTDASEIDEVALIRPSNTTHCVNPEQRYVGLIFDNKSDKVVAEVPTNHNLAPPGHYMLFILKIHGIPSEAKFVHLR
jgi:hypothetical protein